LLKSPARSFRVWLNRWRGVKIGQNVWIGYDAIIETSRPGLVTIGDRATVQIRATVIAHFREQLGVVIEEDATVGPGAIILPNVTIRRGSIVTAGSVVTKSVPPKTMVQGKPARPIARVEVPLALNGVGQRIRQRSSIDCAHIFPECASRRRQVAFCVKSLRSKNYCAREGRAHP
jgi:acetyltransferase-like isoleucine patch superfamily enzyme